MVVVLFCKMNYGLHELRHERFHLFYVTLSFRQLYAFLLASRNRVVENQFKFRYLVSFISFYDCYTTIKI